MKIQRIAAFSEVDSGGNPAGVVVCESLPSSEEMQKIAAGVGWPHGVKLEITQGLEMGSPSRLTAEFSEELGSSIRVSGATRVLSY